MSLSDAIAKLSWTPEFEGVMGEGETSATCVKPVRLPCGRFVGYAIIRDKSAMILPHPLDGCVEYPGACSRLSQVRELFDPMLSMYVSRIGDTATHEEAHIVSNAVLDVLERLLTPTVAAQTSMKRR